MTGAVCDHLPDGRLRCRHGPIELIVEAFGEPLEVLRAYRQAASRFVTILPELEDELEELRRPLHLCLPPVVAGNVAQRMADAVWPHRFTFVTPMAAVAGAVADEILGAMLKGRQIDCAYVLNGEDIALHLGPGTSLNTARMSAPRRPPPVDTFDICAETPVRGLSTSGQVANTVSLGIADRVTVLAASAAAADAAATLIADAVNVDDPAVKRVPASQLDPHSDLGGLPVTVAVGALSAEAVGHALDSGTAEAERLASGGLIHCAMLMLGAQRRLIGPMQAGRRVERIADLAAPSARIGLLAGRTQAVQ